MKLNVLIKTMRPAFLIVSLVCVFLGFSTTYSIGEPIDISTLFLVLLGAIFAQVSVNMLNEYYDFKSGLDLKTNKTPFSGGSGALPNNPKIANLVLTFGLISLFITITIGIYFILYSGPQILPFGIVGIVVIVTYTHWLNRMPLFCLISPGLGLGTLMVVGTHVVLKFDHSQLVWLVSFIPFFLINNLLLLNQYPDMKADASVGRNTFPIAFGIDKSNLVYAIFMLATYSLVLLYIIAGYIPLMSIIAVTPIVFSIFSLTGANRYKSKIGDYPQYLRANVMATILTPLLLGISILNG